MPKQEIILHFKEVVRSTDIETKNQSSIREFMFIGLTTSPELQRFLFWTFLFVYITALVSNILLIFIICASKRLHTPMYFLLMNLSLVNVLAISAIVPKLLQTLLSHKKSITFYGCITQGYLFIWLLSTELVLLTLMAFDRYAAICHPLRYTIIMRKEVCIGMSAGACIAGLTNSSVHYGLILQLYFCQSNIIDHFFCDIPPLLKLSCSDTSVNETMAFVADIFFAIVTCGLTLISYGFILRTIFRIPSTSGKKKAFSTCSSHLFVVIFYFSSVIYTYMTPSISSSQSKDKQIALLYTVVTPVINPIVYSLRNKEVKDALLLLIGRDRLLLRNQE